MRWIFLVVFLTATGCGAQKPQRMAIQHLRAANALLTKGQDAQARKELDAAVAAAPEKFETYAAVAAIMLRHQRYREAADYATFVLDNTSSEKHLGRKLSKDEQLAMLSLRAEALRNFKGTMAAAAVYEKALALDPKNMTVLNNLGYYYAEAGSRLDRALRLTKKAVAMAPNNGIFVDSLGWTYYKLGRYQEAETELRRAVKLTPNEPDIRYHLGMVYAVQGKRAQARIEFEKALVLDPNHTLARAEVRRLPRL